MAVANALMLVMVVVVFVFGVKVKSFPVNVLLLVTLKGPFVPVTKPGADAVNVIEALFPLKPTEKEYVPLAAVVVVTAPLQPVLHVTVAP